ncbi:MAG: hypothetical protein ACRCS9_14010 [Hyphomicrobium sp.]
MIFRIAAGLAGIYVLVTATGAAIVHMQADQATADLIWASVVALVVGAAFIARAKGAARWVLLAFIACSEAYGGWASFERVLETREAKAGEGRAQTAAIAKAEARLAKAEAILADAKRDVGAKAALRDCKVNCRELLQAAVDKAGRDVTAERQALDALPPPAPADVAAAQTGVEAWKISLILAILGTLATNGFGAVLCGIACHGPLPELPRPRLLHWRARTVAEPSRKPLPRIIAAEVPANDDPATVARTFAGKGCRKPFRQVSARQALPASVAARRHKVLRALEREIVPVTNKRLAELIGESEGEASKARKEVLDLLDVWQEGRELRIALKRSA